MWSSKTKSKYQLDAIKNIRIIYDSRQKVTNLSNNYEKDRSEAIDETNQDRRELKILTPKQMLQRLPIALAQVKAGNTIY